MQQDDGHMNKLTPAEFEEAVKGPNADITFKVGEHVKVKGGDFAIASMGSTHMVLRSLPGNRMSKP